MKNSPYRPPMMPRPMSENVYTGMQIIYGDAPCCYVCGCNIEIGDEWRWYVETAVQDRSESRDVPAPAFGCAHGHVGDIILVYGRHYKIAEIGAVEVQRRRAV